MNRLAGLLSGALVFGATAVHASDADDQDTRQTVIVSGDTAVITAKLWAKGIEDGAKVDYEMWFSDVYVRTPKGWSYFFGQASLPLPSRVKR
jgi:ketosteroid isomerase-like protein